MIKIKKTQESGAFFCSWKDKKTVKKNIDFSLLLNTLFVDGA